MVRGNAMPLIRSTSLFALWMCLILSGCDAGRQIYISSSYKALPAPGARVSVVGNNMALLSIAQNWLRDRDLYVMELNPAHSHMTPTSAVPCPEQCEPTVAMQAAKAAGADYAVLFRMSMEHAPERVFLIINGFAVSSGMEIFNASGTQFLGSQRLNKEEGDATSIHILCHALATVWQYRPGGYSADKSIDYCHIPRPHA